MSLQSAILLIAEDLEKEAVENIEDITAKTYSKVLRTYARQLRTAITASEGSVESEVQKMTEKEVICSHKPKGKGFCHCPTLVPVACSVCQLCVSCGKPIPSFDAPKPKVRKPEDDTDIEDKFRGQMAECVGGTSDLIMHPVEPGIPIGARMWICDQIYEMNKDGRLHYQEQATIEGFQKRERAEHG